MSTNARFGLVGVVENKEKKSGFQKNLRKISPIIGIVLAIGFLVPQFARATQIVWTNGSGGIWENALNWQPNQVPGPNDTAIVLPGNSIPFTVTTSSAQLVSNLTIGMTTLVGSNQFKISGQLNMTHATIALPIELLAQSSNLWTQGSFSGAMTIDNGATLVITNPPNNSSLLGGYYVQHSLTNQTTITNYGTMIFKNALINSFSNAIVQNNGLIQDFGNSDFSGVGRSNFFYNPGDYEMFGGNAGSVISWQFNTTGIINTPTSGLGVFTWVGTNVINGFLNTGGQEMPANASITVSQNSTLIMSSMDVNGTVTVDSGAELVLNGHQQLTFGYQNRTMGLTNEASVINNGLVIVTNGGFAVDGRTFFQNAGRWQFESPLTLVFVETLNSLAFNNSGVLDCGTNYLSFSDLVLTNSGSIIAGELEASVLVQTDGSTILNSASLSGLELFGGTFSAAGNIFNCSNSGGTLIAGNPFGRLNFSGIINPYTQGAGGTLDLFIGGATNSSSYSQIAVYGAISSGGQLNIILTNNYFPDLGTSYVLATGQYVSNLLTGFSAVNLPTNIVGMSLSLDSTGTNLLLNILPPIGPTFYKSNFVAQLTGIPGSNYTIETTATLSPPEWQKLTNAICQSPTNGMSGGIQIIDPVGSTNRFYRAVTPAY